MSDSVLPQRRQPTRLPRPWDSPGKNTGVGCHFLLQCMKVKSESAVTQSCPTLSDPMDCSLPGSSVHGIFPGKSTGVGCHCLLCLGHIPMNKNLEVKFTCHRAYTGSVLVHTIEQFSKIVLSMYPSICSIRVPIAMHTHQHSIFCILFKLILYWSKAN